jgi:hypothetical protein
VGIASFTGGVNFVSDFLIRFKGTMVAGRGTFVDLTSTLTMPLLARDRCNGTVDMGRSRLAFPIDAKPFEADRAVVRLMERTIMMKLYLELQHG